MTTGIGIVRPLWQSVPPSLRSMLPPWLDDLITVLLMFAALVARHWKQPAPPRSPDA